MRAAFAASCGRGREGGAGPASYCTALRMLVTRWPTTGPLDQTKGSPSSLQIRPSGLRASYRAGHVSGIGERRARAQCLLWDPQSQGPNVLGFPPGVLQASRVASESQTVRGLRMNLPQEPCTNANRSHCRQQLPPGPWAMNLSVRHRTKRVPFRHWTPRRVNSVLKSGRRNDQALL